MGKAPAITEASTSALVWQEFKWNQKGFTQGIGNMLAWDTTTQQLRLSPCSISWGTPSYLSVLTEKQCLQKGGTPPEERLPKPHRTSFMQLWFTSCGDTGTATWPAPLLPRPWATSSSHSWSGWPVLSPTILMLLAECPAAWSPGSPTHRHTMCTLFMPMHS